MRTTCISGQELWAVLITLSLMERGGYFIACRTCFKKRNIICIINHNWMIYTWRIITYITNYNVLNWYMFGSIFCMSRKCRGVLASNTCMSWDTNFMIEVPMVHSKVLDIGRYRYISHILYQILCNWYMYIV